MVVKIKAFFSTFAGTLTTYGARIHAFRPNARRYLVYLIFFGIGMGVFQLLYNFYVLSLGYDESLLGNLITVNNSTALLAAIPMGYLADRLGRKRAIMSSTVAYATGVIVMVLFPGTIIFFAMNVVLGLAQSLSTVVQSPFLMENSGEEERTYLFSLSFGLRMTAMFVGNWIGGYLPSWLGLWRHVPATSSAAYGLALGVIVMIIVLGLLPLSRLQGDHSGPEEDRALFMPLSYFREHFSMFSKLVLPILVTSFGAGLFMPFMNLFFRQVHGQSDQAIGTLFAWGSLAMAAGFLLAPAIAEKYGKIQLVVYTQLLSIPFLMMLGFSPWFGVAALAYYVRLAFMNMSNPVYQTFVMERVKPEARATAASLVSMAWSSGRAFSPTMSGYLQVQYGFNPVFSLVIVLYSISVYLYWKYFWAQTPEVEGARAVAD
ncbi:MAG: MFS transporter [Anaerolineales bacterium]|nr:MFS transporter [Anaerolineales bacterium]